MACDVITTTRYSLFDDILATQHLVTQQPAAQQLHTNLPITWLKKEKWPGGMHGAIKSAVPAGYWAYPQGWNSIGSSGLLEAKSSPSPSAGLPAFRGPFALPPNVSTMLAQC